MKGFIGVDVVFAVVQIVQAAVVVAFQIGGIKIRLVVDLRIVRHFGGVFDFFAFAQGFKKQAVLFFVSLFFLLDALERTFRPSVIIQDVFLHSGKQ